MVLCAMQRLVAEYGSGQDLATYVQEYQDSALGTLFERFVHLFPPSRPKSFHRPYDYGAGEGPQSQNSKKPSIPYGINQRRANNTANT
jgi:hypothetical protein